jgi:hypothetical protein
MRILGKGTRGRKQLACDLSYFLFGERIFGVLNIESRHKPAALLASLKSKKDCHRVSGDTLYKKGYDVSEIKTGKKRRPSLSG